MSPSREHHRGAKVGLCRAERQAVRCGRGQIRPFAVKYRFNTMVASEPERCEERSAEDRLGSWKAIAAYLKRDVTTVQRWERREGVPVHRHVHETRGCVYAFSAELDAWLKNRRPPRMANLAVHLAGGPGWPQRALSSPLRLSLHCSSKLVTLGHARTAWLPSVACELLRVPRGGPPEDKRSDALVVLIGWLSRMIHITRAQSFISRLRSGTWSWLAYCG